MTRRDTCVGGGIALAWVVVLLLTMDVGLGRDEGYYAHAGERYVRWFSAPSFSADAVERHFGYNPEHPAIYKTLFGLSWRLFGDTERALRVQGASERQVRRWYHGGVRPETMLGGLRESTAFRLPTALTAGLLLWLLYAFGTAAWDRRVGVAAALLFATMPRAFYHSHLAALDLPVTFWNLLATYLFWRSMQDGARARWRPALLCGAAWGVALGVKLNAFFTPLPLVLWWLLRARRPAGSARPGAVPLWPPPRPLLAMAVLGPVLLYALWPRLWHDPVGHLRWYALRHLHHEPYWAYYFGDLLDRPPFPVAFPFVMSAVTLPITTLGLLLAGVAASVRRRGEQGATSLVALSALVPFCIIAWPSVPVFGGTKHWLPAMPFVALLAAVGLARLHDALPRAPAWAVIALFVVPPGLATARAHPDTVAYYNEALGGFAGAGDHGMQREFWGSTAGHVLDVVNALPAAGPGRGPRVDWHDTNHASYLLYLRDGRLRPDVPYWTGRDGPPSDWFLFHWHREFLDLLGRTRATYGGGVPWYVYARDGLPLLVLWGRP